MYDAHRAEVKKAPGDARFLCGDDDAGRIMALLADRSEQRGREPLCGGNGCVELLEGFVKRDDETSRDPLVLDRSLVPLQYDGKTNVEQRTRSAGVHKVT